MSPRSEKDQVPEFESPDDALAWMNAKLDGSWVDAITDEPKPIESFRTESAGLVFPTASVFDTSSSGLTIDPPPVQFNGPVDGTIGTGSTTSTGYRPDMTAAELAAFLDAMWSDNGESS